MSHQFAFIAAVPLGVALALSAHGTMAKTATIAFAVSVVSLFGISTLFHRLSWSPKGARRIGQLDHAAIYGLIAGTYAPIGLLVIDPAWRWPILAAAWGGALLATAGKVAWPTAPTWVAPVTCIGLGSIALIALPQIADDLGIPGTLLLVGGGLAYAIGAMVYVRRRPDPLPATFGYHELFHALVIVAVACQYAAVAFFVLPRA